MRFGQNLRDPRLPLVRPGYQFLVHQEVGPRLQAGEYVARQAPMGEQGHAEPGLPGSARSRRHNSGPLTPGRRTSSSTRSGRDACK